jgi:hypothetical protein
MRVINGETLISGLNAETFQGKKVAVNGFFYQTTGLLWIVETQIEDE